MMSIGYLRNKFRILKKIMLDNDAGFILRKKRYQVVTCSDVYHPIQPVWVNPQRVNYLTGKISSGPTDQHLDHNDSFSHGKVTIGEIKRGDWDQSRHNFEDLAIYQGIYERYVENTPWAKTSLFLRHKKRIENGHISFSSESVDELLKKMKENDELYNNIKENGYMTQKDLNNIPTGEVYVNISREGEILFNGGGRHRLSIAKILGLNKIPVQILVRHEQYMYPGDRGWKVSNKQN